MTKFSQFNYYPCLQSSDTEHLAYRKLSDDDKSGILPIFEINQPKTAVTVDYAVQQIRTSAETRQFILDLSHIAAPDVYIPKNDPNLDKIQELQLKQDEYNGELGQLLEPQNGFENWRSLCASIPSAIPVLQFTDAVKQSNNILRQAALISNNHGQLGIRLTATTNENIFQTIGQIIAIIPNPSDLIIILDAGQSRIQKESRVNFAKNAITRIQSEVEVSQFTQLNFLFLNGSFTSPNSQGITKYANYAWELWDEVNSEFSVSFGDYAAHKRRKSKNTFIPNEWKPTVVYPLDELWLVYRDANSQDTSGWTRGVNAIAAQDEYENVPDCWGGSVFQKGLDNDIGDVSSAKYWHAAKINMHIHRQIEYSLQRLIDDL